MKETEIGKTPFVFYPTFYDQLQAIKNDKVRLVIYDALARYGICGIEPDFSDIDPLGTVEALFVPMRQEIDKAKARYFASVENGKKGGAPKGSRNNPNGRRGNKELTETNLNKPELTETNIDIDIDIDKDIDKEKSTNVDTKKTAKRFSPPSLDEVRDYIASQSYSVDAEAFIDFYEAKGWRVGNNPMKDWKAAVRTWERRNKEEGKTAAKKQDGNTQTDMNRPSDTPRTVDNCGVSVTLGVGEWIDAYGRRTYGSGKATIPEDAPPRPGDKYTWDAATKSWIYL